MTFDAATTQELLDVCAEVSAEFPVIAGGLIDKKMMPSDPAWPYACKALGYVRAKHPGDLTDVLEAFATVSMDFLRLQSRFMKTGNYALSEAGGLVESLYGDEEKMKGYYLDGLAMTYALWPNHARMIGFLCEDFAPLLAPGTELLEVGVGHGLMASLLFEIVPDLRYCGVDISPSSLEYAADSLTTIGIDPSRFRMVNADAIGGDLSLLASGDGFGGLVCCEVLEHVEVPDLLLANLARSLHPEGVAFMSTVANMEAEDHVYLFHDVDHIRTIMGDHGWTLVEDRPLVLPGADHWSPLPVNYSAIARPARS